MKLYKCTFYDSTEGAMLSWHPSRTAAERDLRNQQRESGGGSFGPDSVDVENVPTDKVGLLRWLNIKVTRDNG